LGCDGKPLTFDSCPPINQFFAFLDKYHTSTPTGSETWKNVDRSLDYLKRYLAMYEAGQSPKFRSAIDAKLAGDYVENDDAVPTIFRTAVESMFGKEYNRITRDINMSEARVRAMITELEGLKTVFG
jgi:hypothetical protein